MKKTIRFSRQTQLPLVGVVLLVAIIGTVLILGSHAASPFAASEVENGSLSGTGANKIANDSTASGNSYIQFGSAPVVTPPSGLIKGIDSRNASDSGTISQLSAIGQRLHATVVRFESPSDSVISQYEGNGFTLLPIIHYDTSYFTRHPEIPVYEAENEPYWNGTSPETVADEYVSAASHLPAGKILLLPYDEWSNWQGNIIQEMLSHNPSLKNAITGVAIHPYSGTNDPSASGTDNFKFARIDVWHQHFVDAGINVPWYITEVGWTDADFGSTVGNPTIATYYTHLATEIAKRPWITAVVQYQVTDQQTGNFSNREYTFGVYTSSYQPKPAAQALATWYGGSP